MKTITRLFAASFILVSIGFTGAALATTDTQGTVISGPTSDPYPGLPPAPSPTPQPTH